MTAPIATPSGITSDEFLAIGELLYRRTGIRLVPGKEALVMGRLDRRLRQLGMASYSEYLRFLRQPGHQDEVGRAIDLLTTNETYFFREEQHFDFLARVVAPAYRANRQFRLWSAASSSGEEAYTAAMVLAGALPDTAWEVVGSDVSSRMVQRAQRGIYPLAAAERIPAALLRKYCRKGRDEYDGMMAVASQLRAKVSFVHANLMDDLRRLGMFDVILLRNVMIYFDVEGRAALVPRLLEMLHPGGYLIVGLSETLNGISSRLRLVEPSVYQLPGGGRA